MDGAYGEKNEDTRSRDQRRVTFPRAFGKAPELHRQDLVSAS